MYMVTFYVGANMSDYPNVRRRARELLTSTYGGFTETPSFGGWKDPAGALVYEPATRWECLDTGSPSEPAARGNADGIASALRWLFSQHSVLYTLTPVIAEFNEGTP